MFSLSRHFALLAAGLLSLLAAGCGSTKTGPGQVARDWSCKIREMQIRPIFPPREDFHVGDLYWLVNLGPSEGKGYCGSPEGNTAEFLPMPIHVGFLEEIVKSATRHYQNRPDFPRTAGAGGTVTLNAQGLVTVSASQTTDVTTGSATFNLFRSGSVARTRLVGFPDFMSVKVDRASLGAIIPLQGAFTQFGFSAEDIEEASISIPVAESYGVPIAAAMATLNGEAVSKDLCRMDLIAKGMVSSNPAASPGGLHLVTEVFYTRAIDISIQSRGARSVGLGRDREGAGTTTLPAITTTGIATPSSATSQSATTATTPHMAAVAGGMLQILSARAGVPGVSLSAERGYVTGVSMRRIFERPIAIGYRSIGLSVTHDRSMPGANCSVNLVAIGGTAALATRAGIAGGQVVNHAPSTPGPAKIAD